MFTIMIKLVLGIGILCIFPVLGLDNGLALTPPMGWMSWERFRCLTNCTLYPDDCISEQLFRSIADHLAEDGYLEAGYEYLIIDDCWLAMERDSEDRLQPDPERFPNGIKALADYIHDKGLKFGLYQDYGYTTCAGYPGIFGYMELDAQTFADWGVDYVKLDACNSLEEVMEPGFTTMGEYFNQTGRPMVYSCSFPAYEGPETVYNTTIQICNLWRNYNDIQDSWVSVQDIANWYVLQQDKILQYSGPGHWNDPDMLIIGNYGLSYDQSIAQMTMWTILAAPLIMSNDLRNIRPEFKEILLNADAIRINQDSLGMPGYRRLNTNSVSVWARPINPIVDSKYSYAIGIVNFREGGGPFDISFTLDALGLDNQNGYRLTNVFEPSDPIIVTTTETLTVAINPTGAVLFELVAVEINN